MDWPGWYKECCRDSKKGWAFGPRLCRQGRCTTDLPVTVKEPTSQVCSTGVHIHVMYVPWWYVCMYVVCTHGSLKKEV